MTVKDYQKPFTFKLVPIRPSIKCLIRISIHLMWSRRSFRMWNWMWNPISGWQFNTNCSLKCWGCLDSWFGVVHQFSFLFGWLDIWGSYFIWVFSKIVWVVRALHNKWYDEERNGDDKLSPNFSVGVSLLPPCPLPPCGKLQNCLRNCLSLSLLSAAHDKDGDYHEDGDEEWICIWRGVMRFILLFFIQN